jgi:hypothetical protein
MNAPRTAMLPRFACAATLAAAGCAANPEFRAVGAEQVTATAEATEVHVVVELMNPNDAPVELTEWDYSFTVDDRTAYSGKWMASLTLPPRDRMLALLPAVVPASFGDVSAARWRIGGSVGYRATGQLAKKLGLVPSAVRDVFIWGNHSDTMVPDVSRGYILQNGEKAPVASAFDAGWLAGDFDKTVRTRGKAIIDARGKSSAASAAQAAIDHIHDWYLGTGDASVVSMAIPSDGSYGIPEGLVYSFPCRITAPWKYEIVQGLEIAPATQARMDASTQELLSEREAVKDLL